MESVCRAVGSISFQSSSCTTPPHHRLVTGGYRFVQPNAYWQIIKQLLSTNSYRSVVLARGDAVPLSLWIRVAPLTMSLGEMLNQGYRSRFWSITIGSRYKMVFTAAAVILRTCWLLQTTARLMHILCHNVDRIWNSSGSIRSRYTCWLLQTHDIKITALHWQGLLLHSLVQHMSTAPP